MCSPACMHTHAHTCTRLRHAAARVPGRPASLRAAILRVRHAGDACDFTPLERLHCDLIVMLWRQVRGRGTVRVRLGKIPLDNAPLFNTQEREALLAQIQEILAESTG